MQPSKRRSRSKSAHGAASYKGNKTSKGKQEEASDWTIFPDKVPWVPTTPSTRLTRKRFGRQAAAGCRFGLGGVSRCSLECRGREEVRTSEKFAKHECRSTGCTAEAVLRSTRETAGTFCKQDVDAQSPQQAQQNPLTGDYCGQEDFESRFRVESFYRTDHSEGPTTCIDVSTMPRRHSRNLQWQDARAAADQARSQYGFAIPARAKMDSSNSAGSPQSCRPACRVGGGHRHRRARRSDRSYRGIDGDGRGSGRGNNIQCDQDQTFAQSAQGIQSSSVTHQGGHAAFENQEQCQGQQRAQKDRGVAVGSLNSFGYELDFALFRSA